MLPILNNSLKIEEFVFIGFFLTISGLLNILDFGLTNSIVKTASIKKNSNELNKYLFSIIVFYFFMFLTVELIIILVSFAASSFFNVYINVQLYCLLFLASFLKYLQTFFKNYYIGINLQVKYNIISNIFITINLFFFYIMFINNILNTVLNFFIVYSFFSFFLILLLIFKDNKFKIFREKFSWEIFDKYSFNLYLLNIIDVVWKQFDQIILIILISKKSYANYILANNFSSIIVLCTTPVISTFYSELIVAKNSNYKFEVLNILNKMNLFVVISLGVIIIPIFLMPEQYLFIWLGNFSQALEISDILIYMLILRLITSLLQVPFSYYSIDYNINSLIKLNSVALLVMIPVLVFFTYKFGILGAIVSKILIDLYRLFFYIKRLTKEFSSVFLKKYIQLIVKSLILPSLTIIIYKYHFYIVNSTYNYIKIFATIIIIFFYIVFVNFKNLGHVYVIKKNS